MIKPSEIVEREQEIATLTSAIAHATLGQPQLILIEGPAGIGKSRLIEESLVVARRNKMLIANARGNPVEATFPFGILRQMSDGVEHDGIEDAEFEHSACETTRSMFGLSREVSQKSATSSYQILIKLHKLTLNAQKIAPLFLVIDDAHWCDSHSLDFVNFLIRRLSAERIAIAMSFRPAETTPASKSLRELRNIPGRVTLVPRPLTQQGVSSVIDRRLAGTSTEKFAATCFERSAGNPLMLEELMKECVLGRIEPTDEHAQTIVEFAPRAASRSVLLRLSRLEDPCINLARTMAVLGSNSQFSDAIKLARLPSEVAEGAVEKLVSAEILRSSSFVEFVHPVVQEAIYQDISPIVANKLHKSAAFALHSRGASSEQVATHCLALTPAANVKIVKLLTDAANDAIALGADESAVRLLKRALMEPPPKAEREAILSDLGVLEILRGDQAGIDHLLEVRARTRDPVERGWLAGMIAKALRSFDRTVEAAELIQKSLAELGGNHAELEKHLKILRVMIAFVDRGAVSWSEVVSVMDRRPRPASDSVDGRVEDALVSCARSLRNDPRAECVPLARSALDGGALLARTGDEVAVVAALSVLNNAESEHTGEACDNAIRAANECGSIFVAMSATACKSYFLTFRGELDEAVAILRPCVGDAEHLGLEIVHAGMAACLAFALIERGELAAARDELVHVKSFDVQPDGIMSSLWQSIRLRLLVEFGRNGDAIRVAEQLLLRDAGICVNPVWPETRQPLIVALGRLGRIEEADKLAGESLELARSWGAPRAIGKLLRIRGELDLRHNHDYLDESLEVLGASTARLEYARALSAKGTSLRLARRPKEARSQLEAALKIGQESGATGFCVHVREELALAGAARCNADTGIASLTPSELRVAKLAESGMTNREIASALFISKKTVEVHLSRTYRKLEIDSRRKLLTAMTPDAMQGESLNN